METNLQLSGEVWKCIPGYEGHYQVSNLGRVKSLKHSQEKIMCTKYSVKSRYDVITISKNGIAKCFRMNRLIAIVFIPNPNSLAEVNHINGNKRDNRVENLEWISSSDNAKHAFKLGLRNQSKSRNPFAKTLLNIETGIYYGSLVEAYDSTEKRIGFCQFNRLLRRNKTKFIYA